jgi:ubiquinone/menaquinone biosynthesis C-methylase UbiE
MIRIKRFIEKWHKSFIERKNYGNRGHQPFFHLATQYLRRSENEVIVDVGAGDGAFADLVVKEGPITNLYPLDQNDLSVLELKKRFGKAAHYRAPDKMPFNDSTVSFVHCSHIIEHLTHSDLYVLLSEFNRVLIPGGRLVISAPLLWEGFYNDLSHIKPYNHTVITSYLCKRTANPTAKSISESFRVLDLKYRYAFITENEFSGSIYVIVDAIMYFFKILFYMLGFRRYQKSGYIIILEKSDPT